VKSKIKCDGARPKCGQCSVRKKQNTAPCRYSVKNRPGRKLKTPQSSSSSPTKKTMKYNRKKIRTERQALSKIKEQDHVKFHDKTSLTATPTKKFVVNPKLVDLYLDFFDGIPIVDTQAMRKGIAILESGCWNPYNFVELKCKLSPHDFASLTSLFCSLSSAAFLMGQRSQSKIYADHATVSRLGFVQAIPTVTTAKVDLQLAVMYDALGDVNRFQKHLSRAQRLMSSSPEIKGTSEVIRFSSCPIDDVFCDFFISDAEPYRFKPEDLMSFSFPARTYIECAIIEIQLDITCSTDIQAYRYIYSNFLLARENLVSRPKFSPLIYFKLEFQIAFIELCYVRMQPQGLERMTKLADYLIENKIIFRIFPRSLPLLIGGLAFVMHKTGDKKRYTEIQTIWKNEYVDLKVESSLDSFAEMDWGEFRKDSFSVVGMEMKILEILSSYGKQDIESICQVQQQENSPCLLSTATSLEPLKLEPVELGIDAIFHLDKNSVESCASAISKIPSMEPSHQVTVPSMLQVEKTCPEFSGPVTAVPPAATAVPPAAPVDSEFTLKEPLFTFSVE